MYSSRRCATIGLTFISLVAGSLGPYEICLGSWPLHQNQKNSQLSGSGRVPTFTFVVDWSKFGSLQSGAVSSSPIVPLSNVMHFWPLGSIKLIGSFPAYVYRFQLCGSAGLPPTLSGLINRPVRLE